MEWLKIKDTDYISIEKVGDINEKYALRLSPRPYTPIEMDDDNNLQYLEIICDGKLSTFDIKQRLISLIKEYDESDEVNVFYVNGQEAWMDKATRVGLVNTCNMVEEDGESEYTIYFNNIPFTLSIVQIRQILKEVELYAVKCYKVTEQHLAEVKSLDSKKSILEYDITLDYPSKIELTL